MHNLVAGAMQVFVPSHNCVELAGLLFVDCEVIVVVGAILRLLKEIERLIWVLAAVANTAFGTKIHGNLMLLFRAEIIEIVRWSKEAEVEQAFGNLLSINAHCLLNHLVVNAPNDCVGDKPVVVIGFGDELLLHRGNKAMKQKLSTNNRIAQACFFEAFPQLFKVVGAQVNGKPCFTDVIQGLIQSPFTDPSVGVVKGVNCIGDELKVLLAFVQSGVNGRHGLLHGLCADVDIVNLTDGERIGECLHLLAEVERLI